MIINADDFGLSTTVNQAIVQCFTNGYISRTTAMVNMPCFEECHELAVRNGFLENVGLHIVLDEGIPMTDGIRNNPHFCKNGIFIKGWFSNPLRKFFLSNGDKYCLAQEIEAQMKKFRNEGFTSSHLDSHHFVHTSSFAMIRIVCKLAKKYGFTSMRTISSSHGEGFVKRMLKLQIKKMIEKNFSTTTYFEEYKRYPLSIDDIEYMSHPDIVDGVVVDYESRKTNKYSEFKR